MNCYKTNMYYIYIERISQMNDPLAISHMFLAKAVKRSHSILNDMPSLVSSVWFFFVLFRFHFCFFLFSLFSLLMSQHLAVIYSFQSMLPSAFIISLLPWQKIMGVNHKQSVVTWDFETWIQQWHDNCEEKKLITFSIIKQWWSLIDYFEIFLSSRGNQILNDLRNKMYNKMQLRQQYRISTLNKCRYF